MLLLKNQFKPTEKSVLSCTERFLARNSIDLKQAQFMDEPCILVNETDEAVGSASKQFCHEWSNILAGKALHRAFSVFVFNSANELLLQKRAKTKVTFPSAWTNTCCSHPLHVPAEMDLSNDAIGVKTAAHRKLLQELNLNIPISVKEECAEQYYGIAMQYITRIQYKAAYDEHWGEHEIDYCVVTKSDSLAEANKEEVEQVLYVDALTLKHMLAGDHNRLREGRLYQRLKTAEETLTFHFSPWFKLLSRDDNLLFKWWHNLADLERIKNHLTILQL